MDLMDSRVVLRPVGLRATEQPHHIGRRLELGHAPRQRTLPVGTGDGEVARLRACSPLAWRGEDVGPRVDHRHQVVTTVRFEPMNRQEASLFFRLVTYRYGRGAILISTNKSVRDWTDLLAGDEVLATAILDRLLHKAHAQHQGPQLPAARARTIPRRATPMIPFPDRDLVKLGVALTRKDGCHLTRLRQLRQGADSRLSGRHALFLSPMFRRMCSRLLVRGSLCAPPVFGSGEPFVTICRIWSVAVSKAL